MRSTRPIRTTRSAGAVSALFGVALLGTLAWLPASGAPSAPPVERTPANAAKKPGPAVNFQRDVQPILSRNCIACHGPDEAHRAAGLRLDLRNDAVQPRGSRPAAIVPGHPERSLILARAMASDHAGRMPPPQSGPALTPEQIAVLKTWIRQGAEYSPHWSFVPPKQASPPKARDARWASNPIDHFILATLDANDLRPAPEADRYTLLRRVSLDLRGLPPTPDEVAKFGNDPSPNWYEKAVDQFLADPAYGERWARVWLDLARYADSAGYGSDPLRTIWPYRDWVIQAFNRNLPFDQFTIEQLAGDLLPNATLEQKIATAFNRNTMTNTEGGTDDEEFRVAAVKDRIDTTLQVWMGLTLGCAQCHTHKYDPITHKEYYQLFALFNQTQDADRPDEQPVLRVPYEPIDAKIREIDGEIARLRQQLAACGPDGSKSDTGKKLQEEIQKLERSKPAPATVPIMAELPVEKKRKTHLLNKGNFLDPGEPVEPNVLQAFHPMPENAPPNRLGMARWLVDSRNPLTARVAVNRYWAQLFGAGLVETEEDFGTQGEYPSHPELLDWLAVEYMRIGWDTKAFLKLVVTSATYRQSSRVTPEALEKDPRNRLLSRGPRFRLEAEMVRDQALALSGLLSRKVGGPSVFPPQPPGLWQAAFNGQRTWPTSTGEDRYRRGLYTFWRRTVPYPSLATFDAPSREICTSRRVRTNTPLQALVTLNDPVYLELAQGMARRILKEGGYTDVSRARYGLQLALCRPPHPEQVRHLAALYRSEYAHYLLQPDAARALATEPLGPLPEGMDPAEAAAWTVVANVLLNLDGVLTKN